MIHKHAINKAAKAGQGFDECWHRFIAPLRDPKPRRDPLPVKYYTTNVARQDVAAKATRMWRQRLKIGAGSAGDTEQDLHLAVAQWPIPARCIMPVPTR
jgi:hypothetical protein